MTPLPPSNSAYATLDWDRQKAAPTLQSSVGWAGRCGWTRPCHRSHQMAGRSLTATNMAKLIERLTNDFFQYNGTE